ncbi:outer membrane protein, multidrug efflux system [Malonomonas rubra DSM 5091]|uniref:Outer membrane protein, multidrug efflux system n=1 Tax=Malonomonas rubra DSM 5091 TaxID=1122189 RepID=A0A1M6HEI2_MALRU|nr:hypothetical protein [Malonomonas rubra]SHJ20617.1 outer membrane protein, multidrug efflux system [Malonomonas rubra DSM 5091]
MGLDYQRPEALVPVQYKSDAPWKEAVPSDVLAKGDWRTIYNDPVLNNLEMKVVEANLDRQQLHR